MHVVYTIALTVHGTYIIIDKFIIGMHAWWSNRLNLHVSSL